MIALYFAGVAFASRWETEHGRRGLPVAVA
jgi:hypothetical protein